MASHVQLTVGGEGEQAAAVVEGQQRHAAARFLEQTRDVPLRHLRHVDGLQRELGVPKQLHACGDALVARRHGVDVVSARGTQAVGRHIGNVHGRGVHGVVEQVLELPAHRGLQFLARNARRLHQLDLVVGGIQHRGAVKPVGPYGAGHRLQRLDVAALLEVGLADLHHRAAGSRSPDLCDIHAVRIDGDRQPVGRVSLGTE